MEMTDLWVDGEFLKKMVEVGVFETGEVREIVDEVLG